MSLENKYEEIKESIENGNYWIDNYPNLPIDDLEENLDEAYLKNILKNDENIHRRTFALHILHRMFNEDDDELKVFLAKLVVRLPFDVSYAYKIIDDYKDLTDAVIYLQLNAIINNVKNNEEKWPSLVEWFD